MTARVLVVDDNPANRKLLEVRLNNEYFEVLSVSNRSLKSFMLSSLSSTMRTVLLIPRS
jgi:CheY-like chemotaxis protein